MKTVRSENIQFMTQLFLERQSYRNRKQSNVWQGLELEVKEFNTKEGRGGTFWDDGYTIIYISQNSSNHTFKGIFCI